MDSVVNSVACMAPNINRHLTSCANCFRGWLASATDDHLRSTTTHLSLTKLSAQPPQTPCRRDTVNTAVSNLKRLSPGTIARLEVQLEVGSLITFTSGVGRCFPFWQDVLACYVVNTSAEDDSGKKKCAFALEDYYECLHHKKEVGPLLKSHGDVAARRNRKFCANYDNSTLELWRCRLLSSGKAQPTTPMHRRRVKYGI